MKYYFEKKLENTPFEEAIQRATEALKEEGFGVLTEIDISATMKKKLDVDFRPYRILGACSPHHAYKALSAEDKIGAMLPCNVIVQQINGGVEVAAVDPVASMSAIENKDLQPVAMEVREKLQAVIDRL